MPSDAGVTVKARHIFYDLLGNVTLYDADNPTCGAALAGILDNCAITHDFEGQTNIADQRVLDPWTRISPVEALLDPENGLLAKWAAHIVRDNWMITVLKNAGLNRGVRIEYGKNLLGVECSTDTSDIITAIIPVGQTVKGLPLTVPPEYYEVDGVPVDVWDGGASGGMVLSEHYGDYETPHVFVLDVGSNAKATGTSPAALAIAYASLIRAAWLKYFDEECDLPKVSIKIEFVNLGDTARVRAVQRPRSGLPVRPRDGIPSGAGHRPDYRGRACRVRRADGAVYNARIGVDPRGRVEERKSRRG